MTTIYEPFTVVDVPFPFTLESCLVVGARASLSPFDRQAVAESFSTLFSALLSS